MASGVEKWNIHVKAEQFSQIFVELWPLLERIHQDYPKDIFYIDISRLHHFFDPQTKRLNPKRVYNQDPFWTPDNPFPINSISSDEEILSIWDRKPAGSEHIIFTQMKREVAAMVAMKNLDPANTILVAGFYIQEVKLDEQAVKSRQERKEDKLNYKKKAKKAAKQGLPTPPKPGIDRDKIHYPRVMTCFMFRTVKVKPTPDEPEENQVVLSVEPTMIFT